MWVVWAVWEVVRILCGAAIPNPLVDAASGSLRLARSISPSQGGSDGTIAVPPLVSPSRLCHCHYQTKRGSIQAACACGVHPRQGCAARITPIAITSAMTTIAVGCQRANGQANRYAGKQQVALSYCILLLAGRNARAVDCAAALWCCELAHRASSTVIFAL